MLQYFITKSTGKEQGNRARRDLHSTPLGKRVSCSDASSDLRVGRLWPAEFEVSLHVAIALPIPCKLSHILSFGVTIPAAWAGRSTTSSSATYR